MQNPLEITFHDLEHSKDIEEAIHEKFSKVKSISPNITKCHIILEKLSNQHQTANTSCVRLDLKVPHIKDIVISEKCSEEEADLKKNVIKVFKRGKSLLREEIARRRDRNRTPKTVDLQPQIEEDDDLD